MYRTVLLAALAVLAAAGCGSATPEEPVRFLTVDTDPDWSPDGQLIAFASSRQGGGIYVIRPDGTEMRRLYRGAASDVDWAPDGRHIVFQGAYGIYVLPREGGPPRRLLRGDAFALPAWAPDGRKLAVVRWDRRLGTEIDVVGLVGKRPRRLLAANRARQRDALTASESEPAWSPDGHELAFRSGVGTVVAVQLQTGRRRVLATARFEPAWSPDGRLIALNSDTGELWVVRADGSGGMRLLAANGTDASWAPDSNHLVFEVRHWWGRFWRRPQSLSVVDVRGSGLRKLTFGGSVWDDPGWRGDRATP